ncbi:thioesterase II family protein [Streptomyces sp. NPDC059454]|uniref:thioesterase II family protein n=1 Tax=Streptomyces sp. NPDC059454 TaxID=3346836 RepID=UPI0036901164
MSSTMAQRPPRWLVHKTRHPDAPIDLYCFPHAGGSPGEYVRWADGLPHVQVWGVQLPGRGSRMAEAAITRMPALVEQVLEGIDFGKRFALFGHSLGSLVAFEVARGLQARGRPLPRRLLVSSVPAPSRLSHRSPALHTLPDGELLDQVQALWGAFPEAVTARPDLLRVTLASFRDDLALFENYTYLPGEPLQCPVTAFAGSQEPEAIRDLRGWRAHTAGGFAAHLLPGYHFYHREQRPELLRLIADTLRQDGDTTS